MTVSACRRRSSGGEWRAVKVRKNSRTDCVINFESRFVAALTNAGGVVLVNRPSENTKPTESGRKVTKQIAMALGVVDIPLFDHVISSRDDSYSVRNNDESEVLRFLCGDSDTEDNETATEEQ